MAKNNVSRRFPVNLSHTETSTIKMGKNYPFNFMEVFPGESFRLTVSDLTRLLPQVGPTMGEVQIGIETYVVPWRQLFDKLGLDWDAYLSGGEDGTDDQVLPTITIPETGIEPGTLLDFLGYPTNFTDPSTGDKVIVGAGLTLNALPIVAYMHVINENYRDQNFVAKLDLTKYAEFAFGTYTYTDPTGTVTLTDFNLDGLFPKAWARDYFGQATPNTQRGPGITVPLLGEAPVVGTGGALGLIQDVSGSTRSGSLQMGGVHADHQSTLISGYGGTLSSTAAAYPTGVETDPTKSHLKADLSGVSAIDIRTFRLAARMQRFGEILQTAGARAVEFTYAMFGVRIPDGRVQRPLFYGSFKLPVIFSEVLQTSQSTDSSAQGTLAGHGITGGTNQPIHIKVIEHGYMFCIVHVMPRSSFQNIVPKYLLRSTRWDIPNPLFQHIGDQKIERCEIYPNSANPHDAFGYGRKYSELFSFPSTVHGQMKDALLSWNYSRVYTSEPVLSAEWRYESPTDRTNAVQYYDSEKTIKADAMQMQLGIDLRARRVFRKNPIPGIHIV